jgi:hypothetical protein
MTVGKILRTRANRRDQRLWCSATRIGLIMVCQSEEVSDGQLLDTK